MSTSSHRILEFSPIRPPLVMMEKTIKWKPNKIEIAPNCPRCSSSNTKFCYYNNYSVSQPRYFCKSCRRYWTKGGSLRNVPVGGGCRKSRRCRSTRQDFPPPESTNGSENGGNIDIDIDISAVYAKYSVQNPENYESSEFMLPEDAHNGQSTTLFEQGNDCIDGQDFVYQNFAAFEVGGDQMLWSEGSDLQSFGSQNEPLMVQEFEGFDQRMSENLVTDNWGSFDLSGYEDF
ncbi:hypothetical protein ACS0TY_036722 [Phlomoides rotata]